MKTLSHFRIVLFSLLLLVGYSGALHAQDSTNTSDQSASSDTLSTERSLELNRRWEIKRQIMSVPGVMFDMANLTDNGYVWKNDVLLEGETLPSNEKWYSAGFFFERAGYKGVWLQYAFQLDENNGKLNGFRRSYGSGGFR